MFLAAFSQLQNCSNRLQAVVLRCSLRHLKPPPPPNYASVLHLSQTVSPNFPPKLLASTHRCSQFLHLFQSASICSILSQWLKTCPFQAALNLVQFSPIYFHLSNAVTIYAKLIHSACKCSQRLQTAPSCSKLLQTAPSSSKLLQAAQICDPCIQLLRFAQNIQNSSEWLPVCSQKLVTALGMETKSENIPNNGI